MQDISTLHEEHASEFLALALAELNLEDPKDVQAPVSRAPRPLPLIPIGDYRNITEAERSAIAESYNGPNGVACIMAMGDTEATRDRHPIFVIADQLNGSIPLSHPLTHPLEGHREAISRFGPDDHTMKIYDLPHPGGHHGYREQAETSEMFSAHHDGLGSAGTVETVFLYTEAGPLSGGYTYFQNMISLAVALYSLDKDAFRACFLEDALTIIRPRGKGAIKVKTPIFFINDIGLPQSSFRVGSGEYRIKCKQHPAVIRAANFLEEATRPFSPGSTFAHLLRRGEACLMRNRAVIHGRTPFIDYGHGNEHYRRLLSRKWFMRLPQDIQYKHVPGMRLLDKYAASLPSLCREEILYGEWLYDSDMDKNVRVR